MNKTSVYDEAKEAPHPKCKTHPDAPHGFLRNESHAEDRYVCECEFWEPTQQQPASNVGTRTHGEPVAYLVYAGVCNMRPVYPAHSTRASAEARAREIKSVTEVRPLFLSPQPTPTELRSCGHIKTMQQALEALEIATTPLAKDRQEVLRAIKALQNALKGTTRMQQLGERNEP